MSRAGPPAAPPSPTATTRQGRGTLSAHWQRAPRVLRWGVQLTLLVAVYLGVSAYQTRDALPVGTPFPRLSLPDATGAPVDWDAYQGRPLLVHVWATWCRVCKLEFAALRALAADPPGDSAVVTIVAGGANPEQVARIARESGLNYPILLATEELTQQLRVAAFPTNYYVDRDGQVSASTVGMSTRWSMRFRLWWQTVALW